MRTLENTVVKADLTSLEVMEPKMLVHDELKVIYINEAYEEALMNGQEDIKKEYDAQKAAHEGYATRVHHLPVTLEFMEYYAKFRHDTFLIDLIERKKPVLMHDREQYEMSLFDSFKNMFLARHPECRNIYKIKKKIAEYEAKKAQENK